MCRPEDVGAVVVCDPTEAVCDEVLVVGTGVGVVGAGVLAAVAALVVVVAAEVVVAGVVAVTADESSSECLDSVADESSLERCVSDVNPLDSSSEKSGCDVAVA